MSLFASRVRAAALLLGTCGLGQADARTAQAASAPSSSDPTSVSASARPVSAKAAKPAAAAAPANRGVHRWRTLSPGDCIPLEDAEQRRLPASWMPFAAAVRRCELTAPAKASRARKPVKADKPEKADKAGKADKAQPASLPGHITLLSVFAEDYYRGLPPDTPWADFPRPMLVDATGRCVGALPELYPLDEPRTLTLRHGDWLDGIPQEIRVQVTNPAVAGGDYALPTLRWEAAHQRYVAETTRSAPPPTPAAATSAATTATTTAATTAAASAATSASASAASAAPSAFPPAACPQ